MAAGPLFVPPLFQPQNDAGLSIPGGRLFFFLGDSTTEAAVYSNQALTVALTQPVEADDTGTFPKIFIDPAITYKVVLEGPDDGVTDPHEYFSVYPYKLGSPNAVDPADEQVYWDQPFSWLNTAPALDEVIGIYTAVRPQRIFGDFDGTDDGYAKAWGNWLIAPTADPLAIGCYLNNVTLVGYMRVYADLTVDFFTDGGAPIDLDTGEFITWRSSAADATAGNGSWTITGINL